MYGYADFDELDTPPRSTFWSDLGALLFSFDGRIDQVQALVGLAAATVLNGVAFFGGIGALLAVSSVLGRSANDLLDALLFLLVFVVVILSAWTSLALQVKRWHDAGKSGWFVLLGCIPYVGPLIALAAYFGLPSDSRPNFYGPRPRGNVRPATPADLLDDDFDYLQDGPSAEVEPEWI